MEQKSINFIVLAFVFLIIGAALIGQVASNTNERTSKTNAVDESFDIATAGCIVGANQSVNESSTTCNITIAQVPSGWKITDCPLTSIVVENTTAGTFTALTEGADYNEYVTTGIIQMLNTTDTDEGDFNTTYVSYTHCGDDYLNSAFGRSVLNMVAGFFALALLGVALWLFYSVFKETGILGK